MPANTYKGLPQELNRGIEGGSSEFEAIESLDFEDLTQDYVLDGENPMLLNDNKSTMKMLFMNMANSILGAGIIGLPYAFRNSGVAAGIVMLLVLTVLIDWTLRLIIINNKYSSKTSYQDTVEFCFGNKGKILILLAQGLFAYGGAMAFCVIIGDTIPHVLKSFIPTENWFIRLVLARNSVIIIFTACISFPLCLNRDISKLAKASMFALGGMLVIVSIVIFRGPLLPSTWKGSLTVTDFLIKPSIFQSVSVISFALVCHHNTTFIYHSMKNPTLDRFALLTHISCVVSLILCGIMGCVGFLTFKSNTKGNVLNNFPSDDVAANVARLLFGLNMLTTFPLEIFVVREIVKEFLVEKREDNTNNELPTNQHFIVTTLLVVSTMSVSLFTCNLGAILELVGGSSACLMAYILPPLCYIKMTGDGKSFKEKLPAYASIIFGVIVAILSSTQTIIGAIRNSDAEHCVE